MFHLPSHEVKVILNVVFVFIAPEQSIRSICDSLLRLPTLGQPLLTQQTYYSPPSLPSFPLLFLQA